MEQEDVAPETEAARVIEVLQRIMPRHVDGQQAIIQMRDEGSRNWKQMEWIGFWFEHLVERSVRPLIGGRVGPTVGRVTFDLQIDRVWDLKVHPEESGSTVILNDQEATDAVISDFGGLGFIVVWGNATYDDGDGSFKDWHDALKGGTSAYEVERIRRDAPSRRRKTAFRPMGAKALWLPDLETVARAQRTGWLSDFQEGMRNSNGGGRRSKYKVNLEKVPNDVVIAEQIF